MRKTLCAAQVVPQNVEKLPLYHWRPGARLLLVGSREGARYDADDAAADQGAFQRRVPAELLAQAQDRAGTAGCCAAWGGSLLDAERLSVLRDACQGALVVITAGFGDADLLADLLPVVDAWLLLQDAAPGPLTPTILQQGRHVEVLWRPDVQAQLPVLEPLPAALHLDAGLGQDRFDELRSLLPAALPCYDERHQHSQCACGVTLVWRSGGRSRVDALAANGACRTCGRASGIALV